MTKHLDSISNTISKPTDIEQLHKNISGLIVPELNPSNPVGNNS